MKLIIACLVCLLAGSGIGWYFGSARTVQADQRKLLQEYQAARGRSHMNDAEWADFVAHSHEFRAAFKNEDRLAALLALAVILNLERGDTNKAYERLSNTISYYYQHYRDDGDTNLLVRIQRAATTNSVVAAAISRKAE